MNLPLQFYVFAGSSLLLLIALGLIFKGALLNVANYSAEHAKVYAGAYVKAGCLIAIAIGTTFKEVFQPVTVEQAATFAWWDWVIKFSAPLLSGLAVLSAFLDRSLQRLDEKKNGTKPPFPTPSP